MARIPVTIAFVSFLTIVGSGDAQTIEWAECRVTGVGRSYADGDHRLTVRCEPVPGQTPVAGDRARVFRPAPAPINCAGTWGPWTPTTDWSSCVNNLQTRTESRTFSVTTAPANGGSACPQSPEFRTVMQSCTTSPPSTSSLWGVVDPEILGEFTAAEHDAYSLDGGDGFRYRTWHPQCVSGRCFAHEHGDDPSLAIAAQVTQVMVWEQQFPARAAELAELKAAVSRPVLFGWIGRRMPTAEEPNGHEEPHEGFKVFAAQPGERNDESRTNRVWSLSAFHMGTGGPRRFVTQHHSADIRVLHPDGPYAVTRVMHDTGGTGIVCDPRIDGNKDVVALDFVERCNCKKLGSLYEIWGTQAIVRGPGGDEVYRAFATPALFDPITAFNPANPLEVVYISGPNGTDPRVSELKAFPENDWSQGRGCDRESYAQPGYWYNAGGPTTYTTDAMGASATGALSITQLISAHNAIGLPATGSSSPDENEVNGAFKIRVDWCNGLQHSGALIPRAGVAGMVNKSRLGFKN